jgi:hypothetical protein
MTKVKKEKDTILFDEHIPAADTNIREYWDALDEDGRKKLKNNLFVLIRWISCVQSNNRDVLEHFVLTVNEYYNKNWFALQRDHSKLLWMLLCMCSYDNKTVFRHEYIPHRRPSSKKIEFLKTVYLTQKLEDIELLSKLMTDAEVKELALGHGMDHATIKKIL